ncbi:MAG: hypothetical protein KGZ61_02515 [Sandarakinorhabdus sp.]|nr:hypothetical protein [Sandarakinorhabdus sp.]
MKGLLWTVVAVAGAAWTGLGWLLHSLAGSGGAAVVSVTRWLQLEPASTQWIADGLSLAGGIAQWLVILVWLIGAGALGLLAWIGSKAVDGSTAATSRFPLSGGNGRAQVIDGQVRDKKVS